MADQRPLRILSLDGGGVRGIASLYILLELMHQLRRELKTSEVLRPCDCFDLICGTSTGGLIAIMLGRLRYVSGPTLLRELLTGFRTLVPFRTNFHRLSRTLSSTTRNSQSAFSAHLLPKMMQNTITRCWNPLPKRLLQILRHLRLEFSRPTKC